MKLQPVISKENLFRLFGRVRERFRTSMDQPLPFGNSTYSK
ncbi:hypothetical protein HMPREF0766_11945 [Sphingobacterium spiritivorum ATCC 33861]|uniref:Uncharacterized protein n=1 Tax=Sphingobacterium spiritivorum ATCC 33861 TaxID=525373 RepID=D7VLS5_SPHSI|nr:hypothetical protein HMPREF0766_11945 [Sphingobacterium spiritivorum ATCC 33861]